MSEELGKIWEGLRKGKTIRIYYMKNVFSNKKRKEKVNEKKITEKKKVIGSRQNRKMRLIGA